MNKSDIIKKYLEGESSSEEEKALFSSQEPEISLWSQYLHKNKQKAPSDLEDKIWKTINHRRQKRRFMFGLSAAAASISLVVIFWVALPQQSSEMSLSEKEQLLKDALSMFPEENETNREIIYSDELIEIYVASN